jgi:hypothetical protein
MLGVPVPNRPPLKVPFSATSYASTFEEFRSLAHWVTDDRDIDKVAHIPW